MHGRLNSIRAAAAAAVLLLAAGTTDAAEKTAGPLQQGDWLEVDRKRFQALSTRLDGPQLMSAMPSVLTFAEAARYNTQQVRPDAYLSVEQRNAYYNLISLVIEFDRNTPAPVRDVRFFHAATIVTLWSQIGAIDAVNDVFCIQMSPETRGFLREANKRLFDANMRIASKMLLTWKEPRDPAQASPTTALTAWDYDVRMVRREQQLVEEAIADLKPSAHVRKEIANLDNCVLSYLGSLGTTGSANQWVTEALGKPDFFNMKHRRAIGFAMITMLHKRPKTDFTALLAEN